MPAAQYIDAEHAVAGEARVSTGGAVDTDQQGRRCVGDAADRRGRQAGTSGPTGPGDRYPSRHAALTTRLREPHLKRLAAGVDLGRKIFAMDLRFRMAKAARFIDHPIHEARGPADIDMRSGCRLRQIALRVEMLRGFAVVEMQAGSS